MTTKQNAATLLFAFSISIVSAQHNKALTIQHAEKHGLSISHLDSIYKSVVHVDTSQAVFKTEAEQQAMGEAYMKLLQDFGKFLTANNFKWEKPTKGFNRIYFNSDGTIDYFLYNFQTTNVKPEDQLSQEKQTEFDRLLNLFIKDYRISLTAKTKFAQCSPTRYMPKE
ncbi:MAG TPA: hypothetical protein VI757_16035 [Bacteroidia bacterium]|nr:hypothetical protein [Bacteroidia bacterium]